MNVLARFFLLVGCIFLLAGTPAPSATGRATADGKGMEFKAAFATWNPQNRTLRLMVLPFEPTTEQMSWVERQPEADYQVVESPARPFLRLDLRFKPGAQGSFQTGQVEHYDLSVWRAGGSNHQVSTQGSGMEGFFKLSGDFRQGQPIRVEGRGQHDFEGGTHVQWDFKATCRVFVVPPQK